MSHHCLKHFMAHRHTILTARSTKAQVAVAGHRRPTKRMQMSCLDFAVSQLSPQRMTAVSRSKHWAGMGRAGRVPAFHTQAALKQMTTQSEMSALLSFCMKQAGGLRSQVQSIQQTLTSEGCASARCHQHLQHKTP